MNSRQTPMYTAHYGLSSAPFSLTPDPHFLYLSERHQEALAHLLYGVTEESGFVMLTGEVGTGKTTLCRCLIEQLPDNVDVALLLNPRLTPLQLLAAICDELRISYETSFTPKDFIDTLNSYLLTAHTVGRRTVLILDEAQNLSVEVLEQVRLLTNLETARHKLLQIILVGQPELKSLLKNHNLRQLAQRITARYHLLPLSRRDTLAYINHRMAISGARRPLFSQWSMHRIHNYAGGIPRLINIICDRALLGGYVESCNNVTIGIVNRAVREVRGENLNSKPYSWLIISSMAAITLLGIALWQWQPGLLLQAEMPQSSINLILPPPTETTISSDRPINAQPNNPETVLALPDLLSDDRTVSHIDKAFEVLFSLWKLDYKHLSGKTACERAMSRKLACVSRVGSWEDIRRINKPAVIELVTDDGQQHHAVLENLTESRATLNFAGQRVEYPLEQLDNYWLGQFLLLWEPPSIPIRVLKQGMDGEDVIWLRRHLNMLEGQPQANAGKLPDNFDAELRQRIRQFQQSQGLTVDGVAGEKTMLALSALTDPEPSLSGPLMLQDKASN